MNTREPAVAGRFYPGSKSSLEAELGELIPASAEKRAAIGVLSPHAGYMYSGAVAGAVFAAVHVPPKVVVLCPNHTGRGARLAIVSRGSWRTPLGDAPIDEETAAEVRKRVPGMAEDESAHRSEHSLEVQIPFLQTVRPDFRFVPICVGPLRLDELIELGNGLAGAAALSDPPALLVASSDMSHYEPASQAKRKDDQAIQCMKDLDPGGLFRVVRDNHISMCGCGPAVAVMQACRKMGATRGELVRYANSGDASGDYGAVVGYAGMVFEFREVPS